MELETQETVATVILLWYNPQSRGLLYPTGEVYKFADNRLDRFPIGACVVVTEYYRVDRQDEGRWQYLDCHLSAAENGSQQCSN